MTHGVRIAVVALAVTVASTATGGCGGDGCDDVTITVDPVVVPAENAWDMVLRVRVTDEDGSRSGASGSACRWSCPIG